MWPLGAGQVSTGAATGASFLRRHLSQRRGGPQGRAAADRRRAGGSAGARWPVRCSVRDELPPRSVGARHGAPLDVPASTSNLGPGFDFLGLTLGLWLRVRAVRALEGALGAPTPLGGGW